MKSISKESLEVTESESEAEPQPAH